MRTFALALLRVYRYVLGPLLHAAVPVKSGCRFSPSCAEFCSAAIREHGVVDGVRKGATRLVKCHAAG